MTAIEIHPFGLTVGSFIPIESDPLHAVNDGLDGFVGRSALVRVLDTENEDTVLLAGKEPIEQRCPDAADVEVACRARGKSHSDLAHVVLTKSMAKVGIYSTR